ncbi:MAG TPA: hypothetical protein VFH76_32930 [Kribbella sp.]|nr:hypothetical protein [Kribbella sp.]
MTYCGRCGLEGRHEACVQALVLEPPRYCAHCRRRMIVQVHPMGWTARCSVHGSVDDSVLGSVDDSVLGSVDGSADGGVLS